MTKKMKTLGLCTMAALFVAGQAFAHTTVKDKVVVTSKAGSVSYNSFVISHGCGGDTGEPYPVLGQSAIFPTGARVAWREVKKDGAGPVFYRGMGGGIFDTIIRDHSGEPQPDIGLNLQVTGFAGFSSPFATTQEIVDPQAEQPNVVEGLLWKNGGLEPKLYALTPFKVIVPRIINPSVREVRIRIGVINYCDFNKNAHNDIKGPYHQPKDAFGRTIPQIRGNLLVGDVQQNVNGSPVFVKLPGGNGDNNRQDWWFDTLDGGSALYNDPDLLQTPTHYWTELTVINKDAKGNRIVTVEPTGAAFDSILTGPNTQPFTKGNVNF